MAIVTPRRHLALWMAFAYLNSDVSTRPMLERFPNREFAIPGLTDQQLEDGDHALRKLFDGQRFNAFIYTLDTHEDSDLCYAAAAIQCFKDWLASC